MSQENVEMLRSMWEPFKDLDATQIDWEAEAIRNLVDARYAPDVELRWSASWAGEREYHGRDGVVKAFRQWVEPFSEYRVEVLDYIEVGDRVVVPTRQWGIGEASGVPVEIEVAHVYSFEGGQITRLDEYETLEEALEAAGLSE